MISVATKECLECGSYYGSGSRGKIAWAKSQYCSHDCAASAKMGRAWNSVDRSGGPDACWLWTKSRKKEGYGELKVGGKRTLAHREAWRRTYGEIPIGLQVCHKCDNPPCCNPNHLFLGTAVDNYADAKIKGRHSHGERHGATPFTAEDVTEIRRRCGAGESQSSLAREKGVAHAAISKIVRRETWQHLPARTDFRKDAGLVAQTQL